MARMSNDDVSKNKDYGDSSQLTNWILDLYQKMSQTT